MKKSKAKVKAQWEVVEAIKGFAGYSSQKSLIRIWKFAKRKDPKIVRAIGEEFVKVDMTEMLWILERRK